MVMSDRIGDLPRSTATKSLSIDAVDVFAYECRQLGEAETLDRAYQSIR